MFSVKDQLTVCVGRFLGSLLCSLDLAIYYFTHISLCEDSKSQREAASSSDFVLLQFALAVLGVFPLHVKFRIVRLSIPTEELAGILIGIMLTVDEVGKNSHVESFYP